MSLSSRGGAGRTCLVWPWVGRATLVLVVLMVLALWATREGWGFGQDIVLTLWVILPWGIQGVPCLHQPGLPCSSFYTHTHVHTTTPKARHRSSYLGHTPVSLGSLHAWLWGSEHQPSLSKVHRTWQTVVSPQRQKEGPHTGDGSTIPLWNKTRNSLTNTIPMSVSVKSLWGPAQSTAYLTVYWVLCKSCERKSCDNVSWEC